MTPEQKQILALCDQIEAADAAATEGPWGAFHLGVDIAGGIASDSRFGRLIQIFKQDDIGELVAQGEICACSLQQNDEANATSISILRNSAPELARLIRVRENLIERMTEFITDYVDGFDHEGKALIRANNLLKEVEE